MPGPTRRTRLLLVLVVLLGVGPPAQATEVRVNTLGGWEKRVTIDDEAAIHLLPTRLVDFPNLALIDVMSWSALNASFGVHLALTESDVIAVYGGARSRMAAGGIVGGHDGGLLLAPQPATAPETPAAVASVGATGGTTGLGGLGGLTTAQEAGGSASLGGVGEMSALRADLQATLLYAHRFPEARVGVLASVWADVDKRDEPEEERYEKRVTLIEMRAGGGFDLGDDSDIDFAVVAGFGTFRDEAVDATTGKLEPRYEPDSLWQLGFVARARLELLRGGHLIPWAEFLYRQEGVVVHTTDDQDAKTTRDRTFQGLTGGVGLDFAIRPAEGVLIQPGLGFTIQDGTFENDPDTSLWRRVMALPTYGVAVEAWVADWCALRFSARQTVIIEDERRKEGDHVVKTTETDLDTDVAIGLTFRFAGFSLDFLLNPELFTTGPYLISGSETGQMNLQAALRYGW